MLMKVKSLLLSAVAISLAFSASALDYKKVTDFLSVGAEDGSEAVVTAGSDANELFFFYNHGELDLALLAYEFTLVFPDGLDVVTVADEWDPEVVEVKCEPTSNFPSSFGVSLSTGYKDKKLKVICKNEKQRRFNLIEANKADKYPLFKVTAVAADDFESGNITPTMGLWLIGTGDKPAEDCMEPPLTAMQVTTAVRDINADKAIAGVKYYNVAGVESNEAFDGVNIVVTTYVDGTTSAVKVIK